MITVPDGVTFYFADPTHRAAIDLLVQRGDVPADLGLDEVEQFETAALAAQRVRLDFWRLLRQLWSATWPEAVRSAFPHASMQTYGQHQTFEINEVVPSVAKAWDDGSTFGIFTLPQGRLVTRFGFQDAAWRQPQLGFYLLDSAGDWATSAQLDLAGWSVDDGWQVTVDASVGFAADGSTVDPTPLKALSQAAMAALANALG